MKNWKDTLFGFVDWRILFGEPTDQEKCSVGNENISTQFHIWKKLIICLQWLQPPTGIRRRGWGKEWNYINGERKTINSFCKIWTVAQYVLVTKEGPLVSSWVFFLCISIFTIYTAPSGPVKSFGKMKNCYLEYLKQIWNVW